MRRQKWKEVMYAIMKNLKNKFNKLKLELIYVISSVNENEMRIMATKEIEIFSEKKSCNITISHYKTLKM
jgi:hypothetical protein